MSSFFANIIHRHSGADNLVAPRLRSRFEIEKVVSGTLGATYTPRPYETSDIDETFESSIPENHSAGWTHDSTEFQQTDPGSRIPAAPTVPIGLKGDRKSPTVESAGYAHKKKILPAISGEPVGLRNNLVQSKEYELRSTAGDFISRSVNVTDIGTLSGTPESQPRDRKSVSDESFFQTANKERLSVDQAEQTGLKDDHLRRGNDTSLKQKKSHLQPRARDVVLADVNPANLISEPLGPISRQQDSQSDAAEVVERAIPRKEKAPSAEMHRHPLLETENSLSYSGDLPTTVPADNQARGVHDRLFENELDRQINSLLSRLRKHPKDQVVPSLESDRSFDGSVRPSKPDMDREQPWTGALVTRNTSNNGSLKPPSWLSEMQTEFNRRLNLNPSNMRANPDPVINVTIGRVEVRAVQTEPSKKVGRQGKPSGVMTLEEYLNQREGRR